MGKGVQLPRHIALRLLNQAVSRLPAVIHIRLAAMPITAAMLHREAALRKGAASRHLSAAASVAGRPLGEAEDSPVVMLAVDSPADMVAAVSPGGHGGGRR